MHFKSIKILQKATREITAKLNRNRVEFNGQNDFKFDNWRLKLKGSGIFAIFVDESLIYVEKTESPRDRLADHFINFNSKINSKFVEVDNALCMKKKIEASFVTIPIEAYGEIEEMIIGSGKLLWNSRAS